MLRHCKSARTIWVDAICINQSDVKERNHQVHIMQRIYTNAASVVVWLGPADGSSRAAMDFILKSNGPCGNKMELLQQKDESRGGYPTYFYEVGSSAFG